MADIETMTWRQGAADDNPLLLRLFAADKAAEFAPLGLSPEQLQPLVEMQFRARQLNYTQNNPNALDAILCLADGTPVGRHLFDRQPDAYRTIDIAVLPEYQGRGIGTLALRQIQQLAAVESVRVRLRVLKTSPAARLYERLGFTAVSSDEISFEMEWQPAGKAASSTILAVPEARIVLEDGTTFDRIEIVDRITAFLREIGLEVSFTHVSPSSFLPGIAVVRNGLNVDLDTLLHPGVLLHEAGRLAVMPPSQRHTDSPVSTGTDPSQSAAEEMATIAWSYAAALHIGLPPEIVFHQHGYKGQSKGLLYRFANADFIGLPYLWWIGLTTQTFHDQPSIYPRMTHWLREEPVSTLEPELELAHSA